MCPVCNSKKKTIIMLLIKAGYFHHCCFLSLNHPAMVAALPKTASSSSSCGKLDFQVRKRKRKTLFESISAAFPLLARRTAESKALNGSCVHPTTGPSHLGPLPPPRQNREKAAAPEGLKAGAPRGKRSSPTTPGLICSQNVTELFSCPVELQPLAVMDDSTAREINLSGRKAAPLVKMS